jgi:hypothetical protein
LEGHGSIDQETAFRFNIQFRINPERGVLEFRIYDNWETRYIQPEDNTVPIHIPEY